MSSPTPNEPARPNLAARILSAIPVLRDALGKRIHQAEAVAETTEAAAHEADVLLHELDQVVEPDAAPKASS